MKNLRLLQAIVIVSQIGFVLAAAVAIGIFLGAFLDSRFNVGPLFTLIGALLGTAAGLFSCVQIIRYALRDEQSQ